MFRNFVGLQYMWKGKGGVLLLHYMLVAFILETTTHTMGSCNVMLKPQPSVDVGNLGYFMVPSA